MKKFILLSLFAISTLVSNAQQKTEEEQIEEEVRDAFEDAFEKLGKGVNLTVDKKLFPLQMGNVYVSNKPRATLMTRLKDGTFDKAKSTMTKEAKKGGVKVIEQGEVTLNGRKMIYQYGERTDESGVTLRVDIYAFQAANNKMAFIIGSYVVSAKEVYHKATKDAASTAVYKAE